RDDGETTGEDASQYYSNKLLETTDPAAIAGLAWLRGLYWESQQETQIAARDYSAAIRGAFGQSVDPSATVSSVVELFRPEQGSAGAQEAMNRFPGLADAYLRLARLSAKSAETGRTAIAELDPASIQSTVSQHWKTYFACAEVLFPMRSSTVGTPSRVPALDTAWADALVADYERLLAERTAPDKKIKTSMISHRTQAGDAKPAEPSASDQSNEIEAVAAQADRLYRNALAANSSWSNALLGRGKLLMTKAKALSTSKGTKPTIESQAALMLEAAQQYTLAVQLEPKSRQAFRGRAEAYQSLAGHPLLKKRYSERCRCLSQAAQSADTASQLGRDRDPSCLELLAQVIESEGEIYNELKAPKNAATFFKQASYYWQEAAACPNADRASIQDKMAACRKKIGDQQTLVAESSRDLEAAPEPQLPFYRPGSNLFGNKNGE
ncbi:MAG TPA: hypothetical protein VGP63_26990, partial [Planctomycetaceae bacterium]|nr:hypothetical protein [Planctomycetaceae bacterium]